MKQTNARAVSSGVGARRTRSGRDRRATDRARGIAMVWTALCLVILIGIVGLSLDWAKTVFNTHEMHNAADAGALAGALWVKWDQPTARQVAIAIAYENEAEDLPLSVLDNPDNDPEGEVVLGRWISQRREFIPTILAPNAVKVVGNRLGERAEAPSLKLHFGPVFGADTVNASRYAIAMSRGSTGAGLLTLREYPPGGMGINIGGDVVLTVNGGDIQDNSQSVINPKQAFRASGSFIVDCEELNVCGAVYPGPDDTFWQSVDYSVNANTQEPIPDPLVHVPDLWNATLQGTRPAVIAPPPPDTWYPAPIAMEVHDYGVYGIAVDVDEAGEPVLDENNKYISRGFDASVAEPITGSTVTTYGELIGGVQTMTLAAGYYPGGFKLTGSAKIKLLPGVYTFGGGNKNGDNSGIVMEGGALEGAGVMLYATASNISGNQYWARVSLTGGEVDLTEGLDPDNEDAEPYPGYIGTDYKYIAIFQDRANPNEAKITGNVVFTQLLGTLYFPTAHMVFSGTGVEGGTQLIAGSIETQGTTSLTINYNGRFLAAGYRSILVE